MKKLSILCLSYLFLSIPNIALTESYYVDANSGDDTNPGSIHHPWKSFQKINKATITEGDVVHLKRGSVWRQTLEISGLEGGKQKIVFRPYPDDKSIPAPAISCADDFSGQLWPGVLANGGFENTAPGACSDSTPGWKINLGEKASCQIAAATVRGQALAIDNAGATSTIKSDNFPLLKPHNYQLTGTVDVTGNAEIQVFLRAYLQHGLNQIQRLDTGYAWVESKSPTNRPFLTLNQSGHHEINLRFKGIDTDSALLLFVVRGNATVNIDNIKLAREGVKEWSAALTNTDIAPKILLRNEQRIVKTVSGDTNTPYWYTRGRSSFHIVGTPSVEGDSIEIGQRRTGILLNTSNNILIEDIAIRGCEEHFGRSTKQGAGILITGGSSNNLIRDVTVRASDEGIRIEGDPARPAQHRNNVITGVSVIDNISKGIAIRSYATGTVIRDCLIRDLAKFPDDTVGQDIEGISIGGAAGEIYDTEVSGCSISSIAPSGKGPVSGITVFNTYGTDIHHNFISYSGRNGIILANSSNSRVTFNGVHNTGLSKREPVSAGIAVIADTRDVTKVSILNNTITGCHNSRRFQGGITLQARPCRDSSCPRTDKKYYDLSHVINMNNIVYGCSGEYPFALHAEYIDFDTLTSDHNLYFTEDENSILIVYRGGAYTRGNKAQYSAWKSLAMHNADVRNINRSLESNSIGANPLFTAPEKYDFHLRSDSPARHTSKNKHGATTQMGAY